jgi:hypothetical protein
VKVLESKKKVTSLQVKVRFKIFTSLHVEVPENLLKYCNEAFLLRYQPTLGGSDADGGNAYQLFIEGMYFYIKFVVASVFVHPLPACSAKGGLLL